jgi:hypothetical protein
VDEKICILYVISPTEIVISGMNISRIQVWDIQQVLILIYKMSDKNNSFTFLGSISDASGVQKVPRLLPISPNESIVQYNYDYLGEIHFVILSYPDHFHWYYVRDSLETILGGWMRNVCQKADWMMEICKILVVFSDWMANSFDCILISVELWFLYRRLSGHMPAAGRYNIIPREKVTIGTQIIVLAQHSVWFSSTHYYLVRIQPGLFHR